MSDQPNADKSAGKNGPDPEVVGSAVADIAERSQRLVAEFLKRHAENGPVAPQFDPMNIGQAFLDMTTKMMSDPARMMQAQMTLWQDYLNLWQRTAERMMGGDGDPVVEPERGDRRFKDDAWSENQMFDFIKQSYLLTSRWMQETVNDVEGLDDRTAQKVDFYTRQFVEALSPSNFLMTNPEALRTTVESGGENLLKGLQNLLEDLEEGDGQLRISMTDSEAFEIGHNIVLTPGKVVYRNDLMELIQYTPSTKTVRKTPLLIVPPWINKYYILDLQPANSFIKWAVDQGHTVFIISWVNPDADLAQKSFEDYMMEGPLAAIEAIEQATGEKSVNAIGYCIGGTLLACALAYMAARGATKAGARWKNRVKSATFFTTMTDFSEPGELGVFIDEEQVSELEKKMNERGYLEGREMATTFNMLRANDLVWSFVVNNYLLGKEPFPFDLLYWNSDSTRMPAAMHSFYLRKMYLENLLCQPGALTLGGVKIDLGKIKVPSTFISTREDHIAPWMSTYAATQTFGGPVQFILAASGHIAGVINPPAKNKYCYWTNDTNPPEPEAWLEGAEQHEGSWWPAWDAWVAKYKGGKDVPAREPGSDALPALCDAPGPYVTAKA
jgi:polyhydroxyalkanoate synthase